MEIRVHRKNMDVPQGLLDHAERKLSKLEALVDRSGWVELGFVEEQNPRISDRYQCEIVAHVKGRRLKVEAAAPDATAAFDAAVHKVGEQVRRLKDKRVKRHQGRKAAVHFQNGQGGGEVVGEGLEDVPPVSAGAPADLDEEEQLVPPDGAARIVRVPSADAKPMTPEEAAMQLDLLGHAFRLFINAESGQAAVVYRRSDGDVGLLEIG